MPSIARTVGAAEPAAPCPHKAGTAPRLGADGKAADLGKHENGNAELRPEAKALTLLSLLEGNRHLTDGATAPASWLARVMASRDWVAGASSWDASEEC